MPRKRKCKIYEHKENMAMNTPPCNAASCNLPASACNVPSCILTSCNVPGCNVSSCSAPSCDPLEGLKQFKSNDLTAQRVCGKFIQNLDALSDLKLIGPHLIDNLINPVYDLMVIINSYEQNTKRHENNWKNLFNKYTELCVRYDELHSECDLLKQYVNNPIFENDLSNDKPLVDSTLKQPEEIYREDSLKDNETLSKNIKITINEASESIFSKENNYYSLSGFINNNCTQDLLNIMGAFLEEPFLVIHSSSNNEFVVNTISSSIKMALPREGDYFLCMDDASKVRVNYCNSKQIHVTFVVTRDMDTKHDGKCDENDSYIEGIIPRRKVDIELKENKNAVVDIKKSSIKLDLPNDGEYGMTMVKGSGIQIRYTAHKLSYITILLCKDD